MHKSCILLVDFTGSIQVKPEELAKIASDTYRDVKERCEQPPYVFIINNGKLRSLIVLSPQTFLDTLRTLKARGPSSLIELTCKAINSTVSIYDPSSSSLLLALITDAFQNPLNLEHCEDTIKLLERVKKLEIVIVLVRGKAVEGQSRKEFIEGLSKLFKIERREIEYPIWYGHPRELEVKTGEREIRISIRLSEWL